MNRRDVARLLGRGYPYVVLSDTSAPGICSSLSSVLAASRCYQGLGQERKAFLLLAAPYPLPLRLRGELRLRNDAGGAAEPKLAEEDFRDAIELADLDHEALGRQRKAWRRH